MKIYYFILLIFISGLIKSQNTTFVYHLDYKPNSDSTEVSKLNFNLDVRGKQSVFRSEDFKRNDSMRVFKGQPQGFDMNYSNKQLYVTKNLATNSTKKYVFVPLIFSVFTINIDDKLNWKILDEKAKIGIYDCQKAEVEYGGRQWTSWFTTEIPISEGPYIFKGLPGLIVKISDDKKDYQFELIQIKDFKWKDLFVEKSQKEIIWKEFQKLQANFYKNPNAGINRSDVHAFDDAGNEVKIDWKKDLEDMQRRIRAKNNPLEVSYKIDYKNLN